MKLCASSATMRTWELLWWIIGELIFGAVGFILQVICWGPFLIASKIASLFREPE
jgi:hypothetical protein